MAEPTGIESVDAIKAWLTKPPFSAQPPSRPSSLVLPPRYRRVRAGTTVVLGLLTTKQGALEDAAAIEARIREATKYLPLERLALSPQCGFASGEAGNPLTEAQQEAKLRRIGEVARRVWP